MRQPTVSNERINQFIAEKIMKDANSNPVVDYSGSISMAFRLVKNITEEYGYHFALFTEVKEDDSIIYRAEFTENGREELVWGSMTSQRPEMAICLAAMNLLERTNKYA